MVEEGAKKEINKEAKMAKKAFRNQMAKILEKLSETEITRQTDIVINIIVNNKEFKESKRISIFTSTAGEIMTDAIIKEALNMNKQVFIPKFEKGVKTMEMLRLKNVQEFDQLTPTLWNIRQFEKNHDTEPYQKTGPLDMILMPLVAVTKTGNRLGHGMGYYDRFITEHIKQFNVKPHLIGIALKEQIVDEVPMEDTDVIIDSVVYAE